MAALSAARNTKESGNAGRSLHELPVDAGKVCHQGGIGCLDQADGLAKPGVTATTLVALGRIENTADNSGGADGAVKVLIKEGDFWWGNSASSDAIAADDIGKTCYIVDDQTVALTDGTGTRSAAGKVVNVDASLGVLVRMGL
jgi:hypothetical protein